jgi:hypothetical protein
MYCDKCRLVSGSEESEKANWYDESGRAWQLCDRCSRPDEPIPEVDPYGHHAVAEEIAQLLDRKRADYGSENIKKFGSQGVLVRVSDKVERLINLKDKNTVNFESIEDSWKDLAGYSLLALLELREGR